MNSLINSSNIADCASFVGINESNNPLSSIIEYKLNEQLPNNINNEYPHENKEQFLHAINN